MRSWMLGALRDWLDVVRERVWASQQLARVGRLLVMALEVMDAGEVSRLVTRPGWVDAWGKTDDLEDPPSWSAMA